MQLIIDERADARQREALVKILSGEETEPMATVWWVYGVGPVKVEFDHAGSNAPVTRSVLVSTNQTPKPPPPDTRWFPATKGMKLRYRWTNPKHLPKPSVQQGQKGEAFFNNLGPSSTYGAQFANKIAVKCP